ALGEICKALSVTLRGVLLDAGDTMIGPRGGRWNPRFDFEDILGRHAPQARMELLADAIDAGRRYMTDASAAAAWDRDAYHRVVLTVLGVEEPSIGLLAELDAPMPFVEMVEVFPDVRPTLDALKARRVPVAVVSDTAPGLEAVYRELGLDGHIDVFVISAVLGCRKPDPRMYRAGSEGLGLRPSECVFVDDDPDLVLAAIGLGYEGRVMCRDGREPPGNVPGIGSLTEIV